MIESDADRLAMIQGLGGQLVRVQSGQFMAVFENEFVEALDGSVESRQPVLFCRTSDLDRFQLVKDDPFDICGVSYRLRRVEPDGTGMSRVLLKR